jgi:hypothetical protein
MINSTTEKTLQPRQPRVGDVVRLSASASIGRAYSRTHGAGIITSTDNPDGGRREYEVKWLKSEERMRFNSEDLIVISRASA